MKDLIQRFIEACKGTLLEEDRDSNFPGENKERRLIFPTPHQIAECGGPCAEGGPEACDCGLYAMHEPKQWHEVPSVLPSARNAAVSNPGVEAVAEG